MGAHLPHDLLLEHQAFLRRLAQSLVQDPALADDLVQDTALAALRHPPRPTGSPRAWLATVMRNLVRTRSRGESRRRSRERDVARPERDERGPGVAAELEVQRRVVEAVERLEEPYRTAIVRRYLHDRSAAQIAEELGVPVATVRTRLARALERLRRDLDARDEAGRPSWSVVLLAGLSDTRPSVAGAATAAGGAIVGAKLVGATIVAAAALAGTWWLWAPDGDTAAPAIQAPLVAAELVEPDLGPDRRVPEVETPADRQAVATSRSASAGAKAPAAFALELHLEGALTGIPGTARVEVRTHPDLAALVSLDLAPAPSCTVDLGAVFLEAQDRSRSLFIDFDHPAWLPVTLERSVPADWWDPGFPGGRLEATIALVEPSAIVTGEVRFPDGTPRAPVYVALHPRRAEIPRREPNDRVALDVSHRFRLRADDAEQHVLVAYARRNSHPGDPLGSDEFVPRPACVTLALAPGEQREVEPLELGAGLAIAGLVEPRPPHAVAVTLSPGLERTLQTESLWWTGERFENAGSHALVDERGAFRLGGLGPIPYALHATLNPGADHPAYLGLFGQELTAATVHAPAEGVRLALREVCVELDVVANGRPVPAALVGLLRDEPEPAADSSSSFRMGEGRTFADDQGRLFLHVSPDYGVHVRAEDAGLGEARRHLPPAEVALGGRVTLELPGRATLPASLTLHFDGTAEQLGRFDTVQIEAFDLATWTDDDVATVLDSTLPWDAPSVPSPTLALFFESQGRTETTWNTWTFSRLRPGRYLVRTRRAMANEGPHGLALGTAFVVELGEGQTVHETWHAALGGRVRVEVTASGAETPSFRAVLQSADGERLPVQFHDPRGIGTYRSSLVDTGTFELIPALPAGEYTLELRVKGRGLRSIPVRVDAGRTTEVRVDLSDF